MAKVDCFEGKYDHQVLFHSQFFVGTARKTNDMDYLPGPPAQLVFLKVESHPLPYGGGMMPLECINNM